MFSLEIFPAQANSDEELDHDSLGLVEANIVPPSIGGGDECWQRERADRDELVHRGYCASQLSTIVRKSASVTTLSDGGRTSRAGRLIPRLFPTRSSRNAGSALVGFGVMVPRTVPRSISGASLTGLNG